MAKKSAIDKNKKRMAKVVKYAAKRAALVAMAKDESLDAEERLIARLKMAELPRDSSPIRVRNRCEITGRPRSFYGKFRLSRIALRDLASHGMLPGVVKSSW
jgi:small subunit ribosomal protein S14